MSAKKWERRVRISPEQALRLAKQNLAPDWYQAVPLAMAVPGGETNVIAALEQNFLEGFWIVFLIDPAEFGAIDWLMHLSQLHKRYGKLDVRVMAVLATSSKILLDRPAVEALMSSAVAKYPIYCDRSGTWQNALGVGNEKIGAAILHQGKVIHSLAGLKMAEIENALPAVLRKSDPGLPLWAPLAVTPVPHTLSGIEFGLSTGSPTGFKGEGASIELIGKWHAEKENISPLEVGCGVRIKVDHPILGAVLHSTSGTATPSSVRVFVNGGFLDGAHRGSDIDEDNDGNARVHVNEPAFYSVAKALPNGASLELMFPDPKNFPVALTSLRFGVDPVQASKPK